MGHKPLNLRGCHRECHRMSSHRIPIKTSTYMHYVNFGSEYVSWGGVGQPGVPAPWNCKSSRDVTLHFTVPGGRNPRWPPPHDTMSEKQNECPFFSSRGGGTPPRLADTPSRHDVWETRRMWLQKCQFEHKRRAGGPIWHRLRMEPVRWNARAIGPLIQILHLGRSAGRIGTQ